MGSLCLLNGASALEVTDGHNVVLSYTDSGSNALGTVFKSNVDNLKVLYHTKSVSCGATRGRLYDASENLLCTATYVGNDVDFSNCNLSFNENEVFYVMSDSSGATYTRTRNPTLFSERIFSRTNVNFVETAAENVNPDFDSTIAGIYAWIYNSESITTEIINPILIPTPTINHNVQEYYNSSSISISLNTSSNVNMSIYLDNGTETTICNNCSNINYTLQLTTIDYPKRITYYLRDLENTKLQYCIEEGYTDYSYYTIDYGNYKYSYYNGNEWIQTTMVGFDRIKTLQCIGSKNEGSHSILFESTDENGQANTLANFTVDLSSPTSNNNILGEYDSYTFNLNSSCSDSNLDYCNITLNNQTLALNSSSFTSTLNGNISYSINSGDLAGNIFQENGTLFVNPNQYFGFYDTARALNVENYSFGNYNLAGQYVTIPLYDLGLGTHSLQFSKFGYTQENFQFNFNPTSALNQTFNITPVTIIVKVYDENSPSTQLKFNLSMNNVLNYTQYLNQLNFQKYYNETLTGNLTLTVESSGFSLRKVFTELNPYSAVSHIIYLLADAESTPVVFRTLNLAQTQAIEDVVFTFNKEISGVPTFLGQAKTDSQGYTYFNMDVLTDYEITISKSGYISQVINSIPGKADYTILMEEEGSTSSFLFDDFSYMINPETTPKSLPFNASVVVFDEANLISSMKFIVTGDNTSETKTLTAASGGTIQFEITNVSSQYVLNLTVMREGEEYNFIKKINYYVETATNTTVKKVAAELEGESNNEDRVFMIIIIYIVAVVLGSLFSPSIGAVFGLLPITIFAFVEWITVGIAALFYVFTILGVLYFER